MTELRLNPAMLVATARRLEHRIEERFGACGLLRVCGELSTLASHARESCERIRRPDLALRTISGCIIATLVVVAVGAAWIAFNTAAETGTWDWRDIPTVGEAVANELLLLGAAIWFFVSLEGRRKRARVLRALTSLRTVAHLIDVHQLTKNPEAIDDHAHDTPSSPERSMSAFEVGRYLDYCSEMLSVTGKIAALYGDAFEEPATLEAVNDLEALCIDLERKIWQKIIILESRSARHSASAPGATLLGEAEPEEE